MGSGQGGTLPRSGWWYPKVPHILWWGTLWPGQDDGGTPCLGQQKEYLLRGGRYASCVHAGELSCIAKNKRSKFIVLAAAQIVQIVVNCGRRIAALIARHCLSPTINHSAQNKGESLFPYMASRYLPFLPTAYVGRREGYVLTRVCPSIHLSVHTWGGGGIPGQVKAGGTHNFFFETSHDALQQYPEFHGMGTPPPTSKVQARGVPKFFLTSMMLCNITQNSMGQVPPTRSWWGGGVTWPGPDGGGG